MTQVAVPPEIVTSKVLYWLGWCSKSTPAVSLPSAMCFCERDNRRTGNHLVYSSIANALFVDGERRAESAKALGQHSGSRSDLLCGAGQGWRKA